MIAQGIAVLDLTRYKESERKDVYFDGLLLCRNVLNCCIANAPLRKRELIGLASAIDSRLDSVATSLQADYSVLATVVAELLKFTKTYGHLLPSHCYFNLLHFSQNLVSPPEPQQQRKRK